MPSVEAIYKNTILPLPPHERLRLAKIIVEHESLQEPVEELSVLSIIESLNGAKVFNNPAEVDEYLAEERESWDN